MVMLVLSGPIMALAMQAPITSDVALIVLPPWQDGAAIIDAVEGVQIGPVRAPFAMLVQSPLHDVSHVAYAAGAWWVGGGGLLAALCGVAL